MTPEERERIPPTHARTLRLLATQRREQGAMKVMERIAEASAPPRARITGVVYLLYFLTAISAEVFVGRGRFVIYDAVNLIAYAFYIAVTLLFYYMFKPVNRSLSLLAAVFSLVGCANDDSWPLPSRSLQNQQPGILRALLPPARLPHFQVHLPASNSGRADGVCRFGLADLSSTARKLSIHLP